VNVTATPSELRKTGGCAGCADGGATSKQSVGSGNVEMAFTAADTQKLRVIGLSTGNTGTGPDEIRFGLRLQSGRVEVREKGAYRAERAVAAGDALKVSVRSGVVSYSVNGTAFYTSAVAPSYPLLVDTSFYDLGATLTAVTLARP